MNTSCYRWDARRAVRVVVALLIVGVFSLDQEEQRVCGVDGSCKQQQQGEDTNDECGLYLAPSTIPNAGLGIFSAKPLKRGDVIGYGDVIIPMVDMEKHNGCPFAAFKAFIDYVWNGLEFGMSFEGDNMNDIKAMSPGLDAAINCNHALLNTKTVEVQYEDAGLHRHRNPGAGAIAPYICKENNAIVDIPTGGELFKNYGDRWFTSREHTFGLVPVLGDYTRSQFLLQKFMVLLNHNVSESIKDGIWKLMKTFPWEARTLNALPPTLNDALIIAKHGVRAYHQPFATRSISDLKRLGKCLDSMRSGPSTISGAGRGAFASRFLKNGTIVTGSPLLHIPDRRILNQYRHGFSTIYGDEPRRNENEIVGHQILLNYCYGHTKSTILLCPYGSGVNYINHNKTLANVKIQWAKDGVTKHNASWFNRSAALESERGSYLTFDYVAIRDIKAGEELFLDYGTDWENAWEKHLKNWIPGDASYDDAFTLTKELRLAPIQTQEEQKVQPYPSNVELRCHSILERHPNAHKKRSIPFPEWTYHERGLPCRIMKRNENGGNYEDMTYDVVIEISDGDYGTHLEHVSRVPPAAFAFVNKPYTLDWHMENAFRHEIMIPDAMIPEKWKNILVSQGDAGEV